MAAPYNPVQSTFDKCIRDFKSQLKDDELYSKILQTTTIDQVYDLTDKLQEDQGKNGHMRHLAKIGPFLERLRGYTGAIEVFVQVKPDILALIWGPIKLLLQWTSVLKQSFDAIINTIGDIGDLLPEFQEVMRLFGHNKQINDVLALFFQDILDVYVIALKFFNLGRWKIIFEAMWPKQRNKIQVVMSHIERHTLLMRNEVRLEHIREEYEARLRALDHFERTERSHQKQEYNAIREALSLRTYEEDFYRLCGRICEDTGKWLLRDTTFISWLKEPEKATKLIWLQGIPGAGKTFLSGTIVNEALSQGRTLFVFLSYNFGDSTTALSIIHSLLFQLASDDDDLQAVLCQSKITDLKRDLKVAMELLTTLLITAGSTFIIIDGIDEIDETERTRLLCSLLDLSNSCDEARILISSRIEDDIHAVLHDKAAELRVDSRNAGSIQAFINQQLQKWFQVRDFLPEARAEIERLLAPLSSKANGMFLYARVVLKSIESLDDMITIRNELQVLPETLDDAYARILERINNLHPPSLRDKARKLLGWIGSSSTPLTIKEMEQALTIRMDDLDGSVRVIATLNPVQVCGPIVEVVDDYVQFVHFTVKEYIFSPHISLYIDITESTLSLAMYCIQYPCQRHHDTDLSDEEILNNLLSGAYRLHEFSATMWFNLLEQYIRMAQSKTPSDDLVKLLQLLIERRTSDEFSNNDTSSSIKLLSDSLFQQDYPDVHQMLRDVASFQQKCAEGEYSKRNGFSWISLDPLTITHTSIRLFEVFDELLCGGCESHQKHCHCIAIEKHYGQRIFKCSFLGCSFSRRGFLTKPDRNSHEKHHVRPWKCNMPDCPFSQGFLSRRMRDQHWEQGHQEQRKAIEFQNNPDEDELQPLLFDLVRTNKVQLFKSLLPRFKAYPGSIKDELLQLAAISGSPAMLDVMATEKWEVEITLRAAIISENVENYRHILHSCAKKDSDQYYEYILGALPLILSSKTQEIRLDWEIQVESALEVWRKYRTAPYTSLSKLCKCFFIGRDILQTTENPENEVIVLSIWEKVNLGRRNGRNLGGALVNLASTSCSVKLAKYLIDAGVSVDFRRSSMYFTPLHQAAKQNNPKAAEFMWFLLTVGADPMSKSSAGRKTRRIMDEIGPKNISKWLGMSWDEVVAKAKAEMQK